MRPNIAGMYQPVGTVGDFGVGSIPFLLGAAGGAYVYHRGATRRAKKKAKEEEAIRWSQRLGQVSTELGAPKAPMGPSPEEIRRAEAERIGGELTKVAAGLRKPVKKKKKKEVAL